MKYLLMIYGNQEKWAGVELSPEEIAKQDAWNARHRATGELLGAYGLGDAVTAKLVTRKDGAPAVSDGPYLETKEYMASFYLVDAADEQRAHEIAASMPWADRYPTEVWPVLYDAFPDLPELPDR